MDPDIDLTATWDPGLEILPQPSPSPRGPVPVVEVLQPGRSSLRLEVSGRLDIGRECDGLLVSDDRVSRRHLRLEVIDGQLLANDLGSRNGTWFDGRRLQGPLMLEPGDVLRLGGTSVRLVAVRPPDHDGHSRHRY